VPEKLRQSVPTQSRILAKPDESINEEKIESIVDEKIDLTNQILLDQSKIIEVTPESLKREQIFKSSQILLKPFENIYQKSESAVESGVETLNIDHPKINEVIEESLKKDVQLETLQVFKKPNQTELEDKSESTIDVLTEKILEDKPIITEVAAELIVKDKTITSKQVLAKPLEVTMEDNDELVADSVQEKNLSENLLPTSESILENLKKDQKIESTQILAKPLEATLDDRSESVSMTNLEQATEDRSQITEISAEIMQQNQLITSKQVLAKPKEEFCYENAEISSEAKIESVLETFTKETSQSSESFIHQDQLITAPLILNKERVGSVEKDASNPESFEETDFENVVITQSDEHLSKISKITEPQIFEQSSSQISDINDIIDIISEINTTDYENKKPKFTQLLEDQEFNINDNIHLDCFVEGETPITVKWFFNNQLIQSSNDTNVEIFRELGVCSMEIIQADRKYQGEYSCHGSNQYGNDSTICKLVFAGDKNQALLKFSELLQDQYVEIDSEVYLDCSIKEIRKTDSIEWHHNYEIIEKNKDENIEIFNEIGICSLQIRKMTAELQGHYSCKIRDQQGIVVAETSCMLNLDEQSSDYISRLMSAKSEELFADDSADHSSSSDEKMSMDGPGIAPMFLQPLEDIELEDGEDLELKCQIMGAPIPEIACYFAKNITEKTAIKKIRSEIINYNYETGMCRIEIKNVTADLNEGFYMVKAINDAGSLTTVCQVKCRPRSYPILNIESECSPSFSIELEPEIKLMDGQEVNLVCICVAKPEPEITWLRSAHENLNEFVPVVFNNDMRAINDQATGKCVLRITDTYPQDAGVFICVAHNKHGRAETRTKLTVECMLND
jgi:hypothetical protein